MLPRGYAPRNPRRGNMVELEGPVPSRGTVVITPMRKPAIVLSTFREQGRLYYDLQYTNGHLRAERRELALLGCLCSFELPPRAE